MTTIGDTSQTLTFDKSMYSDPSMRSYLQDYYEDQYTPFRERINGMKEAEANGQSPNTIKTKDGKIAIELSAAQYESSIPSFEKWLDMQQNVLSPFDMIEQSASHLRNAKESIQRMENALNPDQPSDIRALFTSGEKILGYITKEGGVVVHQDGLGLQQVVEQADALNLTGEARIAYIKKYGEEKLSRQHSDLKITHYTDENVPTRREFAAQWYPNHDVDASYKSAIEEAKAFFEQQEKWHTRQMENLNTMRATLLKIMEEAQAAA